MILDLADRSHGARIVKEGSCTGGGNFPGSYMFSRNTIRELNHAGEFQSYVIFDEGDRTAVPGGCVYEMSTRGLEDLREERQLSERLFKDLSLKPVNENSSAYIMDLRAGLSWQSECTSVGAKRLTSTPAELLIDEAGE